MKYCYVSHSFVLLFHSFQDLQQATFDSIVELCLKNEKPFDDRQSFDEQAGNYCITLRRRLRLHQDGKLKPFNHSVKIKDRKKAVSEKKLATQVLREC
jgi:hypothetical protein